MILLITGLFLFIGWSITATILIALHIITKTAKFAGKLVFKIIKIIMFLVAIATFILPLLFACGIIDFIINF